MQNKALIADHINSNASVIRCSTPVMLINNDTGICSPTQTIIPPAVPCFFCTFTSFAHSHHLHCKKLAPTFPMPLFCKHPQMVSQPSCPPMELYPIISPHYRTGFKPCRKLPADGSYLPTPFPGGSGRTATAPGCVYFCKKKAAQISGDQTLHNCALYTNKQGH